MIKNVAMCCLLLNRKNKNINNNNLCKILSFFTHNLLLHGVFVHDKNLYILARYFPHASIFVLVYLMVFST